MMRRSPISDSTPNDEHVKACLAIYEHLPCCLFFIDASGQIEDFRAGTTENPFGPAEALVGRRILEVLTLGTEDDLRESISQALEGETVIRKCRLVTLNDELHFETRLFCSEPHKLLMLVRNITEFNQIKDAFDQQERRLNLIYESTADILYYLEVEPGLNFRFRRVNAAFLTATGLTVEQVVGKTIEEVIPEPALALVRSKYEMAIRDEDIVRWQETSQYPAGLKTGNVTIAPIFDGEGHCTHLVGSVHDITARKRAEETLSALLATVSEVTGDEFFTRVAKMLTTSLGMTYAHISEIVEGDPPRIHTIAYYSENHYSDNHAAEEIVFDLAGTPCETLIDKNFQIHRGKLWEQFPENEFISSRRIQCFIGIPLISQTGKPIGVLCTMSEEEHPDWLDSQTLLTLLAARCAAELERRQTSELLHRQQTAFNHAGWLTTIGELSAGIVHDISQPLFAISGFSGACRQTLKGIEFEGSDKVANYLENITLANETAKDIVKRLRNFIQRQQFQRSEILLEELIEETLKLLAFEIRNIRVTFDSDLAPGTTVCASSVQIRQVLVNLILNACEALDIVPAESRHILIRASIVENNVKISIEDNGTGISEQVAQNLFEPFFTTKPIGLGMGLSVVKNIVIQYDGNIWFTSAPHKGTVFHFTLPIFRKNDP